MAEVRPPATQAALLRDIVGNPFRRYYSTADDSRKPGSVWYLPLPEWLAWNGGTIPKMARRIYDETDWAALPVLADALEDAGCPEEGACPRCNGTGRVWAGGLPGDETLPPGYVRCEPTMTSLGECFLRRPNPILDHLRGPGPPARGCWVLDLILGKE